MQRPQRSGFRAAAYSFIVLFAFQMLACNLTGGSPPIATPATPLIPQFPWPPPKPSAMVVLTLGSLGKKAGNGVYLSDVDKRITAALNDNGYDEQSYYSVPNGFAIVTRMEQINEDGTSKQAADRWITELSPMQFGKFSLANYFSALFKAPKGYYRLFVFMITSNAIAPSNQPITKAEAQDWATGGASKLPKYLGDLEFTQDYSCTVYIYQFEQSGKGEEPNQNIPSSMTGKQHLEKANLWDSLEQ